MTVVNPKSISGINSITTGSGSDNLLTIHTSDASSTERVRINSSGDVIVGSGITVSPDGDIFTTGVTTATTFVGALTGNVTGNVSGSSGSATGNAGGLTGTPNISCGTIAGSTGTFTGDVDIADKIVHTGDTNTAIRFPTGGTITAETVGTERFRIDSNGDILIGHSSNISASQANKRLQIHGANFADSSAFFARYSADGNGACLSLGHSRNATVGSQTIVQDGDEVGKIRFYGSDGNNFDNFCAEIKGQIDGTPGSDDMPGRLVFQTTADGAAAPTERMRINSSGHVLIGADTQGSADGYTNNFMIAETSGSAGMSIQSYNSASSYTTIALGDRTTHNRGYIEQRCGDNNQMTIGLNGNGSFRFVGKNSGGNTAERVRITYDGITFNGDTAATNALDDYEEGTWTPTVISSGGGTTSYTVQQGTYVKVGRVVHITCQIVHTLSGASGYLRIGGIPYNCSNNTGSEYLGVTQWNQSTGSVNTNIVNVVPIIQQNNNYIHFRGYRYPANTAYENIGTAEHSWLRVTMTYETGS